MYESILIGSDDDLYGKKQIKTKTKKEDEIQNDFRFIPCLFLRGVN